MDFAHVLNQYSLDDFPAGLGGCHNDKPFECCEYNITVFDEKKEQELIVYDGDNKIKIHHGSINEGNSNILIQFSNLKIINDDRWELRMMLSKISERKDSLFRDAMKNCLFDALFCTSRAREGIKIGNEFSSCWIKCAAFYLADAIALHNHLRPSPAHMLLQLRSLKNDPINEKLAAVAECIGMERATPTLLDRMCKSTMGFSDMVEENSNSQLILQKHDFLVQNSMIPDCYFFLGYVNRNNMIKVKDSLHRNSHLIHVLKVAMDIENDPSRIQNQCSIIGNTASEILDLI